MYYNICKRYIIASLIVISSVVEAMKLVNLPRDIIASIALQLVENNPAPFAFQNKTQCTNSPDEHTVETLKLLLDHEQYKTDGYIAFTMTCKGFYSQYNMISILPEKVSYMALIRFLNGIRMKDGVSSAVLHHYVIDIADEAFYFDLDCWRRKSPVQWTLKCLRTNQAKNLKQVYSAIKREKVYLTNMPLWENLYWLKKYSAADTFKVAHVSQQGNFYAGFTAYGVLNVLGGDYVEPLVLGSIIADLKKTHLFDWIDQKGLLVSFIQDCFCIEDKGDDESL